MQRVADFTTLLWVGLMAYGCFMPGSQVSQVNWVISDKVIHFLMFFGFTGLSTICLGYRFKRLKTTLMAVAVLSFVWGALIEIIQQILPFGRSADIFDLLYDVFGTIVALIIMIVLKNIGFWNPSTGLTLTKSNN